MYVYIYMYIIIHVYVFMYGVSMVQGVKAVIAESFERIHRSNLVGMGVLPLQYMDGRSAESLGLTGTFTVNFIISAVAKFCEFHNHLLSAKI